MSLAIVFVVVVVSVIRQGSKAKAISIPIPEGGRRGKVLLDMRFVLKKYVGVIHELPATRWGIFT